MMNLAIGMNCHFIKNLYTLSSQLHVPTKTKDETPYGAKLIPLRRPERRREKRKTVKERSNFKWRGKMGIFFSIVFDKNGECPSCPNPTTCHPQPLWRNRPGVGWQSAPRDFPPVNFWWLIGKNEARKKSKKMGNVEENEEKWKKEGWKLGKIGNKLERRKMRNVR